MSERRLTTILFVEVAGFGPLVAVDEVRGMELLHRSHDLIRTLLAKHDGEWLEDSGGRVVAAFTSVVDGVRCATELGEIVRENAELRLRIGVDLGDVLRTGTRVYGEAVNVAASIEALAGDEGVVITEQVYAAVEGQMNLAVVDIGKKRLKDIGHPVRLYIVKGAAKPSPVRSLISGLFARRIPQILGAYAAAAWGVVEITAWLVSQGSIHPNWATAVFYGLLTLGPSVALVAYTHAAVGPDQLSTLEKICVPANILVAAFVVITVLRAPLARFDHGDIAPASIAVLPFLNISQDADNAYFSTGLSEELINALAEVRGISVASRTSSFVFDDGKKDAREIARMLGVATILEGSVRKQGAEIRVMAQLIDGRNNYHLWTKAYDRQLTDIFAIQADIAGAVARELTGVLQPDAVRALATASTTKDVDAYDFYLRGLSLLRKPLQQDTLDEAKRLFERALTVDPDYARAHAGLCEASLEQYVLDRSPALIDVARSACLRALSLDATQQEVRIALGELYRQTGEYEKAERIFDGLLEEDPVASTAWVGLARVAAAQGRNQAADAAFRNAIENEPGNWASYLAYGIFLKNVGRFEEALPVLERVIEISPGNAYAFLWLAATQDYLGDREAALQTTLHSLKLQPTRAGYRDLGLHYYYDGKYEKAADAYERAVELGPTDHWSLGSLANVYTRLESKAHLSKETFARAARLAEAVMERDPGDWTTLAALATYNVFSGEAARGLKQIETAVTNGAHVDEVHYYDAVINSHFERDEQALAALERAVALGLPTNLVARDPQFTRFDDKSRFQRLILAQSEGG